MANPTDPHFPEQLHLRNETSGGVDINILTAWDDYSGTGVQITVNDSGFEYTHPDLVANYRTDIDFDYANGDSDPFAAPSEFHGTSVMGIIGAVYGNDIGGVGVAWGATLVGYRGAGVSGDTYAGTALRDAAGLGDGVGNTNGNGHGSAIISISAGLGERVFETSDSHDDVLAALDQITTSGRGGLGTIVVKSAGNSRAEADSPMREESIAESYDSARHTIIAGGVRSDGWVDRFSSPGANLLVSAPISNIFSVKNVITTDRTGSDGYNTASTEDGGDYTEFLEFGGTSSAAPQVSGVVALMLEANPLIGWRDVQEILAYSARHVGSAMGDAANEPNAGVAPPQSPMEQATQTNGSTWFWNAATNWNGGGLHFSNDYGFGLLDATAAVRMAETWNISGSSFFTKSTCNETETEASALVTAPITLADGTGANTELTIAETDSQIISHVALELDMNIDALADLELFLTSPGGTRVQLLADTGDAEAFDGTWSFGATAFLGEQSQGDWTVTLMDDLAGNASVIRGVTLRTFGDASEAGNDRLVFTDELSEYSGTDEHVTFLDTGLGLDSLNAAAVTTGSVIDLLNDTAVIDGVTLTVRNIENVSTGDGNDSIVGDTVSNVYWTGRGDDTIEGGGRREAIRAGGGDDLLFGNAGNDYLAADEGVGQGGADTVFGGVGNDRIIGGPGIDSLYGDSGDDTFVVVGMDEPDMVDGGEGIADTLDLSRSTRTGWEVHLADGTWSAPGQPEQSVIGVEHLIMPAAVGARATGSSTSNKMAGRAAPDSLFGGAGADEISGGDGDDLLHGEDDADNVKGGAGDDTLVGGADADTLSGGSGDDLFVVSDGEHGDQIDGGIGIDTLDLSGFSASGWTVNLTSGEHAPNGAAAQSIAGVEVILGTTEDDDLTGSGSADSLFGGAGADTLRGSAADDSLDGGDGIDQVSYAFASGAVQTDLVAGMGLALDGTDVLSGFENVEGSDFGDVLKGDAGANFIEGRGGDDEIRLRPGNDVAFGGFGDDSLFGGVGADTLFGDADDDVLFGKAGADSLRGGDGNDLIGGGPGPDLARGGEGDDSLRGGAGKDELRGGPENDALYGGAGADLLSGEDDNDLLIGGALQDTLFGGEGDDSLRGNNGRDVLSGEGGDDLMFGGGFRDVLDGGAGADTLAGNAGHDTVSGGDGADVFQFHRRDGVDLITDFEVGTDLIAFAVEGLAFSDLRIRPFSDGIGTRVSFEDTTIRLEGVMPEALSPSDFGL